MSNRIVCKDKPHMNDRMQNRSAYQRKSFAERKTFTGLLRHTGREKVVSAVFTVKALSYSAFYPLQRFTDGSPHDCSPFSAPHDGQAFFRDSGTHALYIGGILRRMSVP